MSNDLISRSVAIDEFYKRVSGDLTIEDIKYIEKVLEEVPTACHVDMIIDKMEEIIQKYRAIGTPEECREAVEAARRHGNWSRIPCSDRLPEENGNYLCTMQSGEKMVCRYGWNAPKTEKKFFRNNCAVNVIAWKPLSEDYRPQKSLGEDYKQQIMDKFLKVE